MAKEEIIVGLDIGSQKIRALVGKKNQKDDPHIIGMGEALSSGIRRGVIIDVEEAISSISSSLEQAERTSGIPIERAYINIGGNHLACESSRGVIAVSRADSEITEEDVARVIDAASAISIPANYEILHIIPRHFIIDSQKGIKDPVGMSGIRLEVEACIIEGASSFIKNLTKCIYRLGIEIDDIVPSPLAAATAALDKRQKELGVALVDIGSGTCGVIVFEEGDLLHLAVIPVGSSHITNDLAIGLRTSVDVAEKVKLEYGSALPREIDKRDEVDLSQISHKEEGIVSKKHIAEIIEARLLEILDLVDDELRKIGRSGKLPAGIIFTGGGAKLLGLVDLAKKKLKLPVQLGFPCDLPTAFDKIDDPAYATGVGLLLWGTRRLPQHKKKRIPFLGSKVSSLKKWFKNFLP